MTGAFGKNIKFLRVKSLRVSGLGDLSTCSGSGDIGSSYVLHVSTKHVCIFSIRCFLIEIEIPYSFQNSPEKCIYNLDKFSRKLFLHEIIP